MFVQHKKIAGFLLSACFVPALSWAAELQDIKFAELPGEKVELRLRFDELPADPAGYTIEKPARIVLDFENTDNTQTPPSWVRNSFFFSWRYSSRQGSKLILAIEIETPQSQTGCDHQRWGIVRQCGGINP